MFALLPDRTPFSVHQIRQLLKRIICSTRALRSASVFSLRNSPNKSDSVRYLEDSRSTVCEGFNPTRFHSRQPATIHARMPSRSSRSCSSNQRVTLVHSELPGERYQHQPSPYSVIVACNYWPVVSPQPRFCRRPEVEKFLVQKPSRQHFSTGYHFHNLLI